MRELLIRFTVCSLCILTFCNFSYFLFGFEGGTLVPLASVPGHIRIYHEFVDRIENSVPGVTAWHHEALPSECMKIEMSKFTTQRQQFPMMFGTIKSSFYLNQRHLTMWSTSLQMSPVCVNLC